MQTWSKVWLTGSKIWRIPWPWSILRFSRRQESCPLTLTLRQVEAGLKTFWNALTIKGRSNWKSFNEWLSEYEEYEWKMISYKNLKCRTSTIWAASM
jgi:hypothetical protein